MSDMSQGPGWWIASDGKWYPPHLHPSVLPPEPPVPDLGAAGAASGTWSAGAPASGDPSVGSAPGRSRARTPLTVAVGVAVVILLVIGAVVVLGGSKSASAQVVDAVTKTLDHGTAHMTVTISDTANAVTLTGTGSGSIDFTNHAMELDLTMSAEGQTVPVDAVYLGGVVYESIPGLSTLVPGKTWISLDLSALQQAAANDPSAQGLSSDPAVMLQMLAQQGNQVVALGPSTIAGVAVNGYRVTVDPSSVAQQLKKADLPSWMQRAVAELKMPTISLKVFVDDTGTLRSFDTHVAESTPSGSVVFDESLGFSDFGAPVDVNAPPAAQVESYQQFLQATGSAGAPTS